MLVKSIISFFFLVLLAISISLVPFTSNLIAVEINVIASLLFIYSLPYATSLELVGFLLHILSTTLILLSYNPILLICSWELSALSALIILSTNYIKLTGILHYAVIHFAGGALILASIPYTLMFSDFSLVMESLNATQSALLMSGILINCAAFPVSNWLTTSYPYAVPHGTAILQAFVTKSALFVLFYLFSGHKVLIIIGFATAIYGLVYSLWRRKIREILSYNTIAQVGLLIVATGMDADIIPALYSSLIYQTAMYLVASSTIYATGKEDLQELGGLFKKLPLPCLTAIFSLFTMSALPLTITFNAKNILLSSIDSTFISILFLVINYGLVISCGIRVVYFTFFSKKEYTDKIKKQHSYTNIPFFVLIVLCVLPLEPFTSTYSTVKVIEQISLFTGAIILFYLLKTKWYNSSYSLISIGCIYNFGVKLLSCIKAKNYFNMLCKRTHNDIMSFYQKIEKFKIENVSFTILFTLFIFGILVCII